MAPRSKSKPYLRIALAVLLPLSVSAQTPLSSVYCPLLVTKSDRNLNRRLEAKSKWRRADGGRGKAAERRVKFATNIERRAGQMGGRDESADPAGPFFLGKDDPRPAGMPAGAYWTNSGKYFYHSETIQSGLHGGTAATREFEFVFQYRTADGKLVAQRGAYSDNNSSWGWDGRFEYQTKADGTDELVVTQGAMEVPKKMRGANAGAGELPEFKRDNYSRSRHVFKVEKFENGKLYLIDEGSILKNEPDTSGDWISYEAVTDAKGEKRNVLKSAHGYGENYLPRFDDPRKMWVDEYGYTVRVFDMVVREVHVRWPDGNFEKIPMTTRGIAYRMDPKNPFFRVPAGTMLPNGKPADEMIEISTEELPGKPGSIARSSHRFQDVRHAAEVLELRTVLADGTVLVQKGAEIPKELFVTLVEGWNPVPDLITFPSGKKYYLGTKSAGEYTTGAKPKEGEKRWRYGAYVDYRTEAEGRLGKYHNVVEMTDHGEDFVDHLEDFTELYHLSWGAGRPQAYRDELGKWWIDVHAVDADLLKEGLPKFGFPPSAQDFADGYRRHKIHIPIVWVEKNGLPAFEVDDPAVMKEIEAYRRLKRMRRAGR